MSDPVKPRSLFGRDIADMFGDLFGDLFPPAPGPDVTHRLVLSVEEAAAGGSRDVEYRYRDVCEACDGRGTPDAEPKRCAACNGAGRTTAAKGVFHVVTPCQVCRGAPIANPCPTCHGRGGRARAGTIAVGVPAGIANETVLRVPGRGNFAPDGTRGHLFITVVVGVPQAETVQVGDGFFTVAPQPAIPQAVASDPRGREAASAERKRWILWCAAMLVVAVIGYLLVNRHP